MNLKIGKYTKSGTKKNYLPVNYINITADYKNALTS